ncbi:hypothetical protein [Brevibacterium litoralis]|uniref:hypothetical protein n=1 Tax=Brevibacterium litoralis TaxID=3138935 RepID=UPI0032EF5707
MTTRITWSSRPRRRLGPVLARTVPVSVVLACGLVLGGCGTGGADDVVPAGSQAGAEGQGNAPQTEPAEETEGQGASAAESAPEDSGDEDSADDDSGDEDRSNGGVVELGSGGTETGTWTGAEADSRPEADLARSFYSALARAANDGDFGGDLAELSTSARQDLNESSVADIDGEFIGPIPFVATQVDRYSDGALVLGCTTSTGIVREDGGDVEGSVRPEPVRFDLVEESGSLRVDGLEETGMTDCGGVDLEVTEW